MWVFDNIRLKNIFSYEDTFYNFERHSTVPIYGRYLKNGKIKSNGAGKSGLLEAINIAFKGSSIRDVSNKEIVRNYQPFGEVIFNISNEQTQQKVEIYRKIYANSSSQECVITVNGEQQKQLVDNNMKASYIFDTLLKISKADFSNYFLINKANYKSFVSSSNTDKIEVINRFSKADQLDVIIPAIELEIVEIDSRLSKKDREKLVLETKIETIEESIQKEKEIDKDQESQSLLKEYEEKINKVRGNNIKLTSDLKEKESEKKEIKGRVFEKGFVLTEIITKKEDLQILSNTQKEEIKELNLQKSKVDITFKIKEKEKLNKQIKELTAGVVEKKTEISEMSQILIDLENSLQASITCPNCEHKFSFRDKEWSYEHTTTSLKEGREIEEELKQDLEKDKTNIDKYNTELESLKKETIVEKQKFDSSIQILNEANLLIQGKINDLELSITKYNAFVKINGEQLKTIESLTLSYENRIKNGEIEIQSYNDLILAEKSKEIIDPTIQMEKDKEVLNQSLKTVNIEREKILKEKEEKDQWIYNFKKFKSYLANKSIDAINGYCNLYLQKMNADVQVYIEGFKTLANKKTKESIELTILRDGEFDYENYGKFSGGQRSTIDLALILTMQYLINENSESGGLDFIGVDEVLESLDGSGIDDCLNALSQLDQTVYIITHGNVEKQLEHSVIIEYGTDKISRIKDE